MVHSRLFSDENELGLKSRRDLRFISNSRSDIDIVNTGQWLTIESVWAVLPISLALLVHSG